MAIFIVRFKRLLRFALLVWPLHLALCSEPGFEVSLQVTGGAYRLFRQGTDHPELQVTGWSRDSVSHDIVVRFEIYDLLEQPKTEALTPITLHLPADGSTVSQQIPLTEA